MTPEGTPSARGRRYSRARGVAGVVVAGGDLVEEGAGLSVAGEDLVSGVEVVGVLVGERADDRELIGPGGEAGQVLADPDAGGGGVDRVELAADALGGVGLHVEGVEVAEAAGEEDQDHRPRPAGAGGSVAGSGQGATSQEAGGPQAEEAGETDLQELAAEDAVGVAVVAGPHHIT